MTKSKQSEYQPISCAMHSELELAIMHKQHLIVDYMNDTNANSAGENSAGENISDEDNADEKNTIKLAPYDIISRHQGEAGEFLLAINQSDQPVSIRLDKILKFTRA